MGPSRAKLSEATANESIEPAIFFFKWLSLLIIPKAENYYHNFIV